MLLDKIWEEVDFASKEDLGEERGVCYFGKFGKREWILLLHKIWEEVDFVREDLWRGSGFYY